MNFWRCRERAEDWSIRVDTAEMRYLGFRSGFAAPGWT